MSTSVSKSLPEQLNASLATIPRSGIRDFFDIVSAMDDVQRSEHAGETSNDDIVEELRALRQEVAELKKKG